MKNRKKTAKKHEGTGPVISHAMEDYMKAIYQLSDNRKSVSTSQLAERLQCTPASVTNMLQKLSALKMVQYTPYQGVSLTEAGRRVALEVIRHHRLLELYLAEILGYSWDQVHAEADALEHVISEEFEARIDAALGYPKIDPHGHPIPTKEGELQQEKYISLWEAPDNSRVRVKRVSDRDPEVLRYLAQIGIRPNVQIRVMGRDPFNGPVHVQVNQREHTLSEELCRQVFIQIPPSPEQSVGR